MPQGTAYIYEANEDPRNGTTQITTAQGVVQLGGWGYFLPFEYASAIGQGFLLVPGMNNVAPTPISGEEVSGFSPTGDLGGTSDDVIVETVNGGATPATLTDGKLTPAQIPSSVVQSSSAAANTSPVANGTGGYTWSAVQSQGPTYLIAAPSSGSDITANYTAARTAAVTAGQGILEFPDGNFNLSVSIDLPVTLPIGIRGQGEYATVLNWPTDLGSGNYAVHCSGTGTVVPRLMAADIRIQGPNPTFFTLGSSPANMYGFDVVAKQQLERCSASGFYAGFPIEGDHTSLKNCQGSNNYYNHYYNNTFRALYGGAAPTTGNNDFDTCDFTGATLASCGLNAAAGMTGGDYSQCHFGNAPFGVFREEATSGYQAGIVYSSFKQVNFELCGNAHIYCTPGGEISNLLQNNWDNCSADVLSGTYYLSTYPKAYTTVCTSIDEQRVIGGTMFCNPGTTGVISASTVGTLEMDGVGGYFLALGALPFVNGGGTGNITWRGKGMEGRCEYGINEVNQYDLLMYTGTQNVTQFTSGGTAVGVSQQTTTGTMPILYADRGQTNINATGSIAAGVYLMPSATAGKVQTHDGTAASPIVGVAVAAASGGVVLAELRFNRGIAAVVQATGAAANTTPIANGSNGFAWSATRTVDLSDSPQALGTSNPGAGTNGVSASDHVHPMPTSSQLADSQGTIAGGQAWVYNATAGKMEPATVIASAPLWFSANNGQITIPRGHVDDSGSYTQTPASQVLQLAYFVASAATVVGHVKFGTGATAAAGNTLTQAALFTVSGTTLTLVANSASPGTALGAYAQASLALTASYTLTAGVTYAIGILQVGTTSASLMGAYASDEYLGMTPTLCGLSTGHATMPSTVSSPASTGFVVGFFLTT